MQTLRSEKGHENRISTRKVKPDGKGGERQERLIENVNMFKVHYMKELKGYNKTSCFLYVVYTNKENIKIS